MPSMTDTLRYRIAAALAKTDGDFAPDSWDFKLADAVIAELGMTYLDGKVNAAWGNAPTAFHRYVTDWIPHNTPET